MAKSTFWADFKKFITRGNVLDMAVGVVIGGSFSKIVNGLVSMIINPFVGKFIQSGDLDSIRTIITDAVYNDAGEIVTPEVAILWGSWFQTILDFLITAICVFVVLRVIMKTKERLEWQKRAEEEAAAKQAAEQAAADKAAADAAAAEKAAAAAAKQAQLEASTLNQETLLIEIRDLLKKQ